MAGGIAEGRGLHLDHIGAHIGQPHRRVGAKQHGGHIKYAPDPGWQTIARGYEKLEAYVEGWRAGKLQPDSDQR